MKLKVNNKEMKAIGFDELISIIKSLKKEIIVITGKIGTGKTAIALKIAETLDPSFNISNNIDFYHREFLVKELKIKLSETIDFISKEELKTVGLWIIAMYVFRLPQKIDIQVFKLDQEREFKPIAYYNTLFDFPSQSIYQEYKYQKLNFLDQIKDGLKGL